MFHSRALTMVVCCALVALLGACGGKSAHTRSDSDGGSASTEGHNSGGGGNGSSAGGAGGSEASGISCEQVAAFYAQLVSEAKTCDPHSAAPCTLRVSDGLGCGCDTFVNAPYWDQSLAAAYQSHYSALKCNANGNCAPCRAPVRGGCRVMDGCEDFF